MKYERYVIDYNVCFWIFDEFDYFGLICKKILNWGTRMWNKWHARTYMRLGSIRPYYSKINLEYFVFCEKKGLNCEKCKMLGAKL